MLSQERVYLRGLSGSQVQLEIAYLGRPNYNCTSNAVTGEGLLEGIEWLTGTERDTAYLGRPNHNPVDV
jgi:hypothetical protein